MPQPITSGRSLKAKSEGEPTKAVIRQLLPAIFLTKTCPPFSGKISHEVTRAFRINCGQIYRDLKVFVEIP
jgi:hypothetical protein